MLCPNCGAKIGDWPEECMSQRCTYYTHYLRYGPPDMPHAAFHVAEKECQERQLALERMEAEGKYSPGLERIVERLEKEVRA